MNQLPTKADILQWIADHPGATAKRDIARAFGIKGAARIELKRMLKKLEAEGQLEKRKKKQEKRIVEQKSKIEAIQAIIEKKAEDDSKRRQEEVKFL